MTEPEEVTPEERKLHPLISAIPSVAAGVAIIRAGQDTAGSFEIDSVRLEELDDPWGLAIMRALVEESHQEGAVVEHTYDHERRTFTVTWWRR